MQVFIELFLEFVIHAICGWVGHITVKILSFGKVDLPWGEHSSWPLAELIGAAVLVSIGLVATLWFWPPMT